MIGMRGSFQFQYCTTEGIASFKSIISNTDLPSFPFGIEISNIQLIDVADLLDISVAQRKEKIQYR
ncbi:Adenosine kinase 2, partial [Armadillidium vulgare]